MRSCVELPDTTAVNKPVIEFIAQLLHCAVRLAGLGETMDERDERRNAEWKAECVKLLCSSLQNEDPNIFDIESQLGELGIHESVRDERVRLVAAVAIVNIYTLATKAGACVADFSFVLDHPQQGAADRQEHWNTMAQRMVHAFGLSCNGRVVVVPPEDKYMQSFVKEREKIIERFANHFHLSPDDARSLPRKCAAEGYATLRRFYRGMRFASLPHGGTLLIYRIPDSKETGDALPMWMPAAMNAALEHGAPHVDVIALSGECGGGKTFCAMLAACKIGITFYVESIEFGLRSLETRLCGCDPATCTQIAAEHLLTRLEDCGWTPALPTERNICLVINYVGPYQRSARAICKLQSRKEDKQSTPQLLTSEQGEHVSSDSDAPPRKVHGAEAARVGTDGNEALMRVPVSAPMYLTMIAL